jgi:hypothetical protein
MDKFRKLSISKYRLVFSVAYFNLSGMFLCVSEHVIFYGAGLLALRPIFAAMKVRILYRGSFPFPKVPDLGR